MGLKASGSTQKSSLKFILGYTDNETVKLDLDNTPFSTVRKLALTTMRKFRLEGFIVLKSSENCYHIVFNRPVDWSENMSIVAWTCLEMNKISLDKWWKMQCIKQSSTLRISPKGRKKSPRIICIFGKQDKQIASFLHERKTTKKILRRLRAQHQ